MLNVQLSDEQMRRVAQIQARFSKATRGPWRYGYVDGSGKVTTGSGGTVLAPEPASGFGDGAVIRGPVINGGYDSGGTPLGVVREADAAFLTHSWEDISFLLDVIGTQNGKISVEAPALPRETAPVKLKSNPKAKPNPRPKISASVKVEIGQVWESCDRRDAGNRLEILSIEGHRAVCSRIGKSTTTKIRLDRFRPTASGYRLVSSGKRNAG